MSLLITGVFDGPLPGGLPKGVELYATADIADLSSFGVGSANNGGGTDGEEFALSGSVATGTFIYVTSDDAAFQEFFGFAADFISSAVNINGDDAIELFENGAVIDVFGDINTDGTGEPWEHTDGWAYSSSERAASTTFDPADWSFSGTNALDNETTNALAENPFPLGTFTPPAEEENTYTLELLHFTDQEAASAAVADAPNLSAVLNALRAEDLGDDGLADNTITLSAGDAFIPGVFFSASEDVFGSAGIADIQIQNELGVDAVALGNHEFDRGTGTLAGLISGDAPGDFSALVGSTLEGLDFTGTDFPYLSANLDFASDPSLADLEIAGGQAPQGNVVTSSTVLSVPTSDGSMAELIGVVGATTPTLASISSPGSLGIDPTPFGSNPTPEEFDALAAEIQAEVDALLLANPGMNKVILTAHMQQINIEQALAERLTDVDIIIAGGSNTRLFDDNDRPRDGDSDQGQYPLVVTNAGGTDTLVVNTDGSYKYVGRLVIDFDADGNIIADSYDAEVSGAYATDDQGVFDLNAVGLVDPEIQAIADAIETQIIATEGNVFGVSDVFLNGNRSGTFAADDPDGVRTQETNLGNLTADANLAAARETDPTVVVAIKNGGGIRANIGEDVVLPGSTESTRIANEEIVDGDANIVKPTGGISQTDIQTTLAFNNSLVLLTVTKEELVALLEHGVGALPGVSGRFPQVSGVKFSFDETQPSGDRIQSAALVDADGNIIEELVRDGEISGDGTQEFRITTLGFLAEPRFDDAGNFTGGGDGYPFPNTNTDPSVGEVGPNAARVNLVDLEQEGVQTGDATFADDGTEQDALAEYLDDNFNPENGGTAFAAADAGPDTDDRIQNLSFRAEDIFEKVVGNPAAPVATEELGDIVEVASLDSGAGEGGSEDVVYDDGRLYTTNGAVGAIDVWDVADQSLIGSIDLTFLPGFASLQSVAAKGGLIAAAVSTPDVLNGAGEVVAQNGYVVLIDADTLQVIDRVTVGVLPDMVTFNEDGTRLLVANEGEFNSENGLDVDPIGSVSIIDVSNNALDPVGQTIDFAAFDALPDLAAEKGIRLAPGASLLTGLEPEYITVSGDTAYISLQEANAIAVLDIPTATFTDIFSAGVIDHSLPGNEIDPLDDDEIAIRSFDNLVGMRMPDSIASFEKDGQTYLITANEGDGRGDAPAGDEARVGDILDGDVPGLSIDASVDTTGLERLNVSTIDGDVDGDGDIDVLHAFGSRSFTIYDTDGNVIFDSGSQFEAILAEIAPERFNDDDGDAGQNRADSKGPEPEAVVTGTVNGVLYAFIGLERDSGIMVYNIDDPARAVYVDYIPGFGARDGDHIAPETIAFIPAEESPTGQAQIAAAYEVTGETVIYDLGEPNGGGGNDQPILISEFQPNPAGADPATVSIELTGTPNADFDVWLLSVESDLGNPGVVDRAENVTGTFDANGIAIVAVPDLENPSFTYVLADDFTGAVGTDLDNDDDGVADSTSTLGTVLDAIGVPDAAGEPLYADQLGGADLADIGGEAELLFRDSLNGDLYSVLDGAVFDANGVEVDVLEFDVDPTQTTFGEVNPARVGAQPSLQVTEIWPGQDGADLTEVWFEVTNEGSAAFNAGTLYYDDEIADIGAADIINGIGTLAVGETAVVVVGTEADAAAFIDVWQADVDLSGVQVGWTDGAGLGGSGGAVALYLDTNGTLTDDDLVDFEAYPDTAGNSGRSWDVANAQFSDVDRLTNVTATTATAGETGEEPAIASPGGLTTPILVEPLTAIYDIQGSGDASAFVDQTVVTRGVVTAAFLAADEIGSFFIQDIAGDGDMFTSDGISIFSPGATVQVGDYVEIKGTVVEFFDKTQIGNVESIATLETGFALPEAVDVAVDGGPLEQYEGMLINLVTPSSDDDGLLAVTETFNLARFGSFEVAPDANVQPTQIIDPTAANANAIAALNTKNLAERILVDDGSSQQNRSTITLIDDGAGGAYDATDLQTSDGPTLRIGAEFAKITGVLDFAFGNYALQYDIDQSGPLTPEGDSNDRPELPEVGGDLQVASFNVLNFFTTLDEGGNTTINGLGPRGADNATEFGRQLDKLIVGITDLKAEIVTLQELENNGFGSDSAIATLVDALNIDAGGAVWSFVDYTDEADADGLIGSDAITTGMIYRNDAVTEVGKAVLQFTETTAETTFDLAEPLNAVVPDNDALGDFQRNRPATAATFEDAEGGQITVVSNHFKSKGDSNLQDVVDEAQSYLDGGGTAITQAQIDAVIADPNFDQGDGQAFWNAVRAEAAAELAVWLDTNPTGVATDNILITGDLNAYGLEDPVDALVDAGYVHLVGGAPDDYGFTFFGQQGALDHVFASTGLAEQVTGAAEWHTNADEPRFLDYNTEFGAEPFFDADNPYRASDHDPVVVGLTLSPNVVAETELLGKWTFSADAPAANSADGFDNIAQFNGNAAPTDGAVQLDGSGDYIFIDNIDDYEIATGGVRIGFVVDELSGVSAGSNASSSQLQTLFSRDSSGFDGGGHLTAFVDGDGSIFVRHQTATQSYDIRTDAGIVGAGDRIALVYQFSETEGMILKVGVNGGAVETVGANDQPVVDGDFVSFIGNAEPWTLGASQVRSNDAAADRLRSFFEGKIDSFEVFGGTDEVDPPENQAPMAVADFAATIAGVSIEVDVLANDVDSDQDVLSILSVGAAGNGIAAVSLDNTVVYTPTDGFVGTDTFTYVIEDTFGATATASVEVTVEDEVVIADDVLGLWEFSSERAGENSAPLFDNVAQLFGGAIPEGDAITLDGQDDYILIDNIDDYEIEAGAVGIAFSVDTLSGIGSEGSFKSSNLQALFSRDSSGFDGGGHVTAFVDGDGAIVVRHQTEDSSFVVRTASGLFEEGDNVEMLYAFDQVDGMEVFVGVNGAPLDLVGANDQSVIDGDPLGLLGNFEPWTIGASQARSSDGVANKLQNFFDGSVDAFVILETTDLFLG